MIAGAHVFVGAPGIADDLLERIVTVAPEALTGCHGIEFVSQDEFRRNWRPLIRGSGRFDLLESTTFFPDAQSVIVCAPRLFQAKGSAWKARGLMTGKANLISGVLQLLGGRAARVHLLIDEPLRYLCANGETPDDWSEVSVSSKNNVPLWKGLVDEILGGLGPNDVLDVWNTESSADVLVNLAEAVFGFDRFQSETVAEEIDKLTHSRFTFNPPEEIVNHPLSDLLDASFESDVDIIRGTPGVNYHE